MNAQLLSAQNSALIATVNKTDGAAQSPFSYSLDRFTPSHAFQKIRIRPQQTNFRKSQTLSFNLPRIAWVKKMTFSAKMGFTTNDMFSTTAGSYEGARCFWKAGGLGLLPLIRRITYESSTRTLYETTGDAILALISDLSAEAQLAVANGLRATVDPFSDNPAGMNASGQILDGSIYNTTNEPANQTTGYIDFSLDLLMCITLATNLCVPLQFVEASRVTIQLADKWECGNVFFCEDKDSGTDGVPEDCSVGGCIETNSNALTMHDPRLNCTFIQLEKQFEEAVLADLFSSSTLTELTWNTETLQTVKFPVAATGEDFEPISIRLDSTKCISDIYFWWRVPRAAYVASGGFSPDVDDREAAVGVDLPLPIEWVTLELSNEKVLDEFPAKELSMYGRVTTSGEHGGWYAVNPQQQGFRNRNPPLSMSVDAGGGNVITIPMQAMQGMQVPGFQPMNTCYVYKIDMSALNSNNKTYSSGFTSLRSISTPTLTIKPPQQSVFTNAAGDADPKYRNVERFPANFQGLPNAELCVVLRTGALTSFNGSDGKVINQLSN